MLLEFRVKNYKSFKDEMVFSMCPDLKENGLSYSILQETISRRKYKGLCSAVIYGPNASGKTNLVGAMETFRSIFLRGDTRDHADIKTPNTACGFLELIPNSEQENVPVEFKIKFTYENILFEYFLEVDLGNFLEPDFERKRKILSESLSVNTVNIFSRHGTKLNIYRENLRKIKGHSIEASQSNFDSIVEIAQESMNDEELFVKNGFKTMFSPRLSLFMTLWFNNDFFIIYGANMVMIERNQVYSKKIEEIFLDCIRQELGIANTLSYRTKTENKDGDNREAKLFQYLWTKQEIL